MEEEDGKGNNPQATALKKDHGNNLTGKGQVFANINNHKTCHADGRGRCEEGIHKG